MIDKTGNSAIATGNSCITAFSPGQDTSGALAGQNYRLPAIFTKRPLIGMIIERNLFIRSILRADTGSTGKEREKKDEN
ncbi:hypothetical protein [Candidatus Formimonas warabiya]|uniref:Uncharacterized protein n=1 Tax=Formimonas warabiya TaxID=1761012 RepID=A0A3G1KUM3_FORW1|nr:hypothetical protein [Candidatus Formimonas warabiya]ATW26142.1 hypothetical protein DCMF_16410 [Candidatus Formimonas warabiya]